MTIRNGIIPVNKPRGYTSNDIVRIMRKMLGQKRIGHTGTLDPEVEGVLPICIGKATRLVEYIQELPKRYRGSFILGISTDTQDQTGKVTEEVSVKSITQQEVNEAFKRFIGTIEQIPPMYSAVRVNGQRLYQSARKGEEVNRSPRQVKIYELICLNIKLGIHPIVEFDVLCSKGTYVRTLCVDIGQVLGVPAHMNSLVRTQSGPFHVEDCYSLSMLEKIIKNGLLQEHLTHLDEVLGHFPSIVIPENEIKPVLDGCSFPLDHNVSFPSSLFRVYGESGTFCALYEWDSELGLANPKKVFQDVEK